MKTIELKFSKSTGLDSVFENIKKITIQDNPFAEGGFGKIYHCVGFDNGNTATPQVMKIFKESGEGRDEHSWNTINKLQARIIDCVKDYKDRNEDFLAHFPALIAVPQLVFSGQLDGQTARGYVSTNLVSLNYKSFEDILAENRNEFIQREMDDKYVMCYHLAKSFKLLESIHFIHADLSVDNIFISMDNPYCAIIDFDSGAVIENVEDNPSTWGKPQDWLAPEIHFALKKSGDVINLNLYSDVWSVCVAMHYMLVTTSPYQFLVDLSKNALTQYTNKYKWPKIDRNDSFFSQGSQDWYEFQLAIIENFLAEEIIEEFECTFTQGVFNPTMRTSYYKWELIFKKFIPERYKIWSKPNISPKPTIDDNEVAKGNSQNINDENLRNLKNYLNDLIRDIIFEGEKLKRHLPFIKGMSEKANLNADNITQEFKDFIELYYNAIADKRVTKFERTSLYLQGEFALLDRQTVDSLIPDYYNE